MTMQRAYHDTIGEPLQWIALAFFQPTRFRRACEPTGWQQRARMLVRLIIPLFLLAFLFVIFVRTVLLPAHIVDSPDETSLLLSPHALGQWVGPVIGQWLVPVIGVAFGLAWGIIFGIACRVAFGIVVSLTAGIVFGLPGLYALLYTAAIGA